MDTTTERNVTADEPRGVAWLVDPRPLSRGGLAKLLEPWVARHGLDLRSYGDAEEVTGDEDCRLVVAALGEPATRDGELCALLAGVRERVPAAPLVVVADRAELNDVLAALKQGVRGYITTRLEPDVVAHALSLVLAGGVYVPPSMLEELQGLAAARAGCTSTNGDDKGVERSANPLSDRQRAVLRCLHQGKSNKMIARELDMRESTVKVHVRQILRKLGAVNRTQAALAAAEFEATYGDGHENAAPATTTMRNANDVAAVLRDARPTVPTTVTS
jgi:DNA-binding NarL/FixJ family response regulator